MNVLPAFLALLPLCVLKRFLTLELKILQGFHHMPETRGLCLSEEQTVSSVCLQNHLFFPLLTGLVILLAIVCC